MTCDTELRFGVDILTAGQLVGARPSIRGAGAHHAHGRQHGDVTSRAAAWARDVSESEAGDGRVVVLVAAVGARGGVGTPLDRAEGTSAPGRWSASYRPQRARDRQNSYCTMVIAYRRVDLASGYFLLPCRQLRLAGRALRRARSCGPAGATRSGHVRYPSLAGRKAGCEQVVAGRQADLWSWGGAVAVIGAGRDMAERHHVRLRGTGESE